MFVVPDRDRHQSAAVTAVAMRLDQGKRRRTRSWQLEMVLEIHQIELPLHLAGPRRDQVAVRREAGSSIQQWYRVVAQPHQVQTPRVRPLPFQRETKPFRERLIRGSGECTRSAPWSLKAWARPYVLIPARIGSRSEHRYTAADTAGRSERATVATDRERGPVADWRLDSERFIRPSEFYPILHETFELFSSFPRLGRNAGYVLTADSHEGLSWISFRMTVIPRSPPQSGKLLKARSFV